MVPLPSRRGSLPEVRTSGLEAEALPKPLFGLVMLGRGPFDVRRTLLALGLLPFGQSVLFEVERGQVGVGSKAHHGDTAVSKVSVGGHLDPCLGPWSQC